MQLKKISSDLNYPGLTNDFEDVSYFYLSIQEAYLRYFFLFNKKS